PRAMHIYDPATDAWTTSPDSIPEGVNHAGLVYLDGKLYLVGGFRGATFDPIDAVWIYDIAAGTWTAGPPLPTARGAMAVAVLNGKIHVIGGNAANAGALNPAEHNVGPDASSVGTHEVFDPATGQWTRLPPMPTARNHAGAAVLNGRIHVFAGRVGSNDTLFVHEVFDPATNAWTTAPRVPTGRRGVRVRRRDVRHAGGHVPRGRALRPGHQPVGAGAAHAYRPPRPRRRGGGGVHLRDRRRPQAGLLVQQRQRAVDGHDPVTAPV